MQEHTHCARRWSKRHTHFVTTGVELRLEQHTRKKYDVHHMHKLGFGLHAFSHRYLKTAAATLSSSKWSLCAHCGLDVFCCGFFFFKFYYDAIDRALEELKAKHPGEGIHLIGHSIGGAVVVISVWFFFRRGNNYERHSFGID